jgi:hypothetical protein
MASGFSSRLFLVNTVIGILGDGREAKTRLRGRNSAGVWGHPSGPTFGEANTFTTDDEIVINEIMYNAPNGSAEEWVELYEKSGPTVSIGGWHFSDGVAFTFPANTMLGVGFRGVQCVASRTAAGLRAICRRTRKRRSFAASRCDRQCRG